MVKTALFFILSVLAGPSAHVVNSEMRSPGIDQDPVLRFGIVSDVQYCDCEPYGTRHYSLSLDKLSDAIDTFNSQELSFVINIGDIIDRGISSYDSIMPLLAGSVAPVYNILGNHDFSVEKRERRDIKNILRTGEGYYSFSLEGFRFIILNSTDISLFSPEARSRADAANILDKLTEEDAVNAYDWNGTIGENQRRWLITQLDEAAVQNEKVILFSHHPVWPESQFNMFNYESIVRITESYSNIGAWFSGHNHDGSYGNYNLIHFVSFKGMVETEDLNSYAIVELYHNKIWIKGYGREKGQILAW